MNAASEPEPDADPTMSDPPGIDSLMAPPPAPPVATKPAARAASSGGGAGSAVLLSFVLSALLGAGGYYAWTHPSAPVQQRIDDAAAKAQSAGEQMAALGQQMAALGARVEKLENAPAPAAPSLPADVTELPKRVDDLAGKLDALANRPAPAPQGNAPAADNGAGEQAAQQAVAQLGQSTQQGFAAQKAAFDELSQRLDQMGKRVAMLEQGVGTARGTAATSVRLTRIEAALVALQAGQPLGVIPGAPAALARFATVAPPSEAKLREDFPALADHAQAVSEPDLSGRSFWQRALTRLQSAVTVRQGGDVLVGDPAAGILSDARVRVANGDIAGAVQGLRQLSGPAASAMQGWVDEASALIAARAALADLAAHA